MDIVSEMRSALADAKDAGRQPTQWLCSIEFRQAFEESCVMIAVATKSATGGAIDSTTGIKTAAGLPITISPYVQAGCGFLMAADGMVLKRIKLETSHA